MSLAICSPKSYSLFSLRSSTIEIFILKIIENTKECVCVWGGVATGACAHEGQKSALDSLQLKTDSCAPPYVGPGNWTWSSKRTSYFF